MKNLTAVSAVILFTVCLFLRLASADDLVLSRSQRTPTTEPDDLISRKRIRLGTFLQKQSSLQEQYNRYLSPASNQGTNAVLPVVNFTNMDGILLNMLRRRFFS